MGRHDKFEDGNEFLWLIAFLYFLLIFLCSGG